LAVTFQICAISNKNVFKFLKGFLYYLLLSTAFSLEDYCTDKNKQSIKFAYWYQKTRRTKNAHRGIVQLEQIVIYCF